MTHLWYLILCLSLAGSAAAEWGSLDSDSGLLLTPPQQYARVMEVPQNVHWSDKRIVRGADLRTGAVIAINGKPYVVTCAHDHGGYVKVGQWVDFQCNTGASSRAQAVAVDERHDCSLFLLYCTYHGEPFALAENSPQVGERVRQAGFPMGQQLRDRYTLVVAASPEQIHIRANSIQGDSGSPIINERGELCGELFGGDIYDPNTGQRTKGSLCCGVGPIRAMVATVSGAVTVQQQQGCGSCSGGVCGPPPGYWNSPPIRRVAPRPSAPPRQSLPTPSIAPLPQPPQANPPREPAPPRADIAPQTKGCDCAEKLAAIEAAVKAGACKCKPCDLTAVMAELKVIRESIGGIKIPEPAPAPQPDEGEQHVVVVADQNAPYWQRLSENVNRTKQTYHGLQVAGLPRFPIGIHPQAVVYRNSVPVRIVKGNYEVEALLSRLARGEAI